MSEHTAEFDVAALVREAYRLGYKDCAHRRDFDPGVALDLLADTRAIPLAEGDGFEEVNAKTRDLLSAMFGPRVTPPGREQP